MEPRIETLSGKKFAGKRVMMSFSNNKTYELWRNFMPERSKINNNIGTELYSIEIYPPLFFDKFNPEAEFEKWAAVEVTDFDSIPEGMETLVSSEGLYAVFVHKGPASSASKTYQYIFETWFPNSDFLIDNRPHFYIFPPLLQNEGPDSEEELWIPVKDRIIE